MLESKPRTATGGFMKRIRFAALVGICFAMGMLITGCGGGGDDAPLTTTGKWGFVDPAGNAETLDIVETGNTIAGTTSRGGTVSGGGTSRSRDIVITYPSGYCINMTLVLDGCTLSGTVTDCNGETGTIVLTMENCGDGGGDISTGVYTGTESLCMSFPGIPQVCADAPIQFYVDPNGQIVFGSDTEIDTGGGHVTLSSSQTGNQFTLTTTATVPGAGSLTVTYSGTITESTITGTITGSGSAAGMAITMSGTFTATRGTPTQRIAGF
jgi:hypothetical protein